MPQITEIQAWTKTESMSNQVIQEYACQHTGAGGKRQDERVSLVCVGFLRCIRDFDLLGKDTVLVYLLPFPIEINSLANKDLKGILFWRTSGFQEVIIYIMVNGVMEKLEKVMIHYLWKNQWGNSSIFG